MKLLILLIPMLPLSLHALTVNEFIDAFQNNSPKLMELKSNTESIRAEYSEAKSEWLPKVSFNMGYLDSESPAASRGLNFPGLTTLESKNYSASLNLDQMVFAGGRIYNNIKLKKSQIDMSDVMFSIEKQRLSQQALLMALQLKFSQENLLVLQRSLKTQKRFLSLVNKRLRSGLARQFDYDKTLGGKISYELRIEQIIQENGRMMQQLVSETGLSRAQIESMVLPEISTLNIKGKKSGFVNNLEYKSLLAEQKITKRQLSLEKAKNRPQLSFGASLGREALEFSDLNEDTNETKTFYVNLKVPLFAGLSSYHLRRKNKSKNFSLEKKQKDIVRNFKVQVGQLEDRIEKNKSLLEKSKKWKNAASRGLKRVLESYRLGQVENSQVVLMQSDLERASMSYLDLIQLYYKDYIAWNSIQGNNIEDIF